MKISLKGGPKTLKLDGEGLGITSDGGTLMITAAGLNISTTTI